jgi:hypothetical protein
MFRTAHKVTFQSFVLTAAVILGINPAFANTKTLPDLVVTNYQDDSVSSLINVVGKTFVRPGADIPAGNQPLFVANGDFNEDKLQDAAVVNDNGQLTFMLGRGKGEFEPLPAPYNLGYSASDTLAVTDFNNDGHADILVASQADFVQVLLGDGNLAGDPAGHFIAQAPVSFASRANALAVADFNKDGKMDAVVCDYNSNLVYRLSGNGQGVLVPIQSLSTPTRPQEVTVGDFNADGNLDIAVGGGLDDYAAVYLGLSNGSFNPAGQISVVTRSNSGLGTIVVAAADMNNDGYDDLVTLGGGSGPSDDAVIVRLWDSSQNNFVAGGSVPAQGAWLAGFNVADLNADGNKDVVFTNQPASFVVVVHFGDGLGNLGPRNEFAAGNDPNAIAVFDSDPILHDFTTRIRFANKADLAGDLKDFKKKDRLYVTLEDIRFNKNIVPSVASLRLRQGTKNKLVKFVVRPDGSLVAATKLDEFNAGPVSVVIDVIVPVSGTTVVPDFIVHRKADITIH